MITFEGPQCMWTNPSKKYRQGSDPPILAMPVFWEHLIMKPLPSENIVGEVMGMDHLNNLLLLFL